MPGVFEIVSGAMSRKESIGIIYHGGSNPGSYREILPLKITLKGKLQAKCLASNAVKLFVFDSIEIAAKPVPVPD